jgi:hypothetical protein
MRTFHEMDRRLSKQYSKFPSLVTFRKQACPATSNTVVHIGILAVMAILYYRFGRTDNRAFKYLIFIHI